MAPSVASRVTGVLLLACVSSALHKDIIIEAIPGGIMSMATGVDKGPFCTATPVNFTQDLRAVGGTFIRTHDAQTIDWDVQFPFPLLDADPDDPSNYNFTLGDATMAGDSLGVSRIMREMHVDHLPPCMQRSSTMASCPTCALATAGTIPCGVRRQRTSPHLRVSY